MEHGRHAYCKPCVRAYRRQLYATNEQHRQRQLAKRTRLHRERYHSDPEYRERVKEQRRQYRRKQRLESSPG